MRYGEVIQYPSQYKNGQKSKLSLWAGFPTDLLTAVAWCMH